MINKVETLEAEVQRKEVLSGQIEELEVSLNKLDEAIKTNKSEKRAINKTKYKRDTYVRRNTSTRWTPGTRWWSLLLLLLLDHIRCWW